MNPGIEAVHIFMEDAKRAYDDACVIANAARIIASDVTTAYYRGKETVESAIDANEAFLRADADVIKAQRALYDGSICDVLICITHGVPAECGILLDLYGAYYSSDIASE